jgi:hypothetical protein
MSEPHLKFNQETGKNAQCKNLIGGNKEQIDARTHFRHWTRKLFSHWKKGKLKSYLNDMREREREREREVCFTNVLCNIGIAGWGWDRNTSVWKRY